MSSEDGKSKENKHLEERSGVANTMIVAKRKMIVAKRKVIVAEQR